MSLRANRKLTDLLLVNRTLKGLKRSDVQRCATCCLTLASGTKSPNLSFYTYLFVVLYFLFFKLILSCCQTGTSVKLFRTVSVDGKNQKKGVCEKHLKIFASSFFFSSSVFALIL